MSDVVDFSRAIEQMILSQADEKSIKFELITQKMTGVVKILLGTGESIKLLKERADQSNREINT